MRELRVILSAMDHNRVFHVLLFEVSLGQTQAPIFLVDDVFAVDFAGCFHHVRKNHGELARTTTDVGNLAALVNG